MRDLRQKLLDLLSQGTWAQIQERFLRVDLQWREDLEPGSGKPKYVGRVLEDLADDDALALARRCLERLPSEEATALQDAFWSHQAGGARQVTNLTRLAVADALDGERVHLREPISAFLERATGYSCPEFEYGDDGRVMHQVSLGVLGDFVPQPASHRDALRAAGFFEWPDQRVSILLEALVHPETRQGEEQLKWVERLNDIIRPDGFKLEETERLSGHPVFRTRRVAHGVAGRPKNLVFASIGAKPEIGFSDAVNNDIVILKHAEKCLVYDEPIKDEGLLWDTLVTWYMRTVNEPREQAARNLLGKRLMESIQSPVERSLFKEYFLQFRPRLARQLPALIPQVYLHYDPRSVAELMGKRRFLVQRMDFLLLLPNRIRVVLEVDGQQHYSESGKPSTKRYAETVRSDRDLRLAGYDVYRFGGSELQEAIASQTVREFFERLFRRYL